MTKVFVPVKIIEEAKTQVNEGVKLKAENLLKQSNMSIKSQLVLALLLQKLGYIKDAGEWLETNSKKLDIALIVDKSSSQSVSSLPGPAGRESNRFCSNIRKRKSNDG